MDLVFRVLCPGVLSSGTAEYRELTSLRYLAPYIIKTILKTQAKKLS